MALGFDGRKCPVGNNPLLPLNLFSNCKDFKFYEKKKSIVRHKTKKKKKKKKRVHLKSKNTLTGVTFFSSSSQESDNNYYSNHHGRDGWWWLNSNDETETLFYSRNLSSDSSESFTGRQHHRRRSDRKRCSNGRQRRHKNRSIDMGADNVDNKNEKNKVKESFAVVKRSSDPYNDFRTSMVEMIIERLIFCAEEDFTEIWETYSRINQL
ncbi:hypothetical protein V6N13_024277 [Hibiscus sabdariffa]|uniref:Transcription repressor n=1 Tax=Hibiscus sabdariffa TaxID=183260 RepID=A0ABR2BWZ8_9ROSI